MMLPELREITDELYKNCFLYEVTTIEKIKRKRFYRNYISRRKK